MSSIELVSEHGCYGGVQRFYKHSARETRGSMKFSVYLPPQARSAEVPVLYYLSGLTCTEETFPIKGHAQQTASELGLMLVAPDTSPREPRLPGDADNWDFRAGRGLLRGRNAGAVGDELPDVQLRYARAAGSGGGKPAREGWGDRNLRTLDGRAWRAHLRAAQSFDVPVGFSVCADRGADAVPVGQESVHELSRREPRGVARA